MTKSPPIPPSRLAPGSWSGTSSASVEPDLNSRIQSTSFNTREEISESQRDQQNFHDLHQTFVRPQCGRTLIVLFTYVAIYFYAIRLKIRIKYTDTPVLHSNKLVLAFTHLILADVYKKLLAYVSGHVVVVDRNWIAELVCHIGPGRTRLQDETHIKNTYYNESPSIKLKALSRSFVGKMILHVTYSGGLVRFLLKDYG